MILAPFMAMVLIALWPSLGMTQDLAPVEDQDAYRLPLGWLNGGSPMPLELRGSRAAQRLAVPIPSRYRIEEARLELQYNRSLALNRRSQLAIGLNERIYAQLPLGGEGSEHIARIRLPPEALRPGFPELVLRAAQHYTDRCEDPDAPELYTQIDAEASALLLRVTRRPLQPSLARLEEVFDRRLWLRQYPLEVILPAGEDSAELLPAAAQAVQAVAARLQYLPMRVQVRALPSAAAEPLGEARFPGIELVKGRWDAILLGTRKQLAAHLHPRIAARIRSAYLGLYPSDADPGRYVLIVSGVTPAQVMQAAQVLSLEFALPDAQEAVIDRLDLPPPPAHPASAATARVTFSQLGRTTVTYQNQAHASATVEFWAFREWLDPAAPYLELTLNYAYGAGLDPRSALNVHLNGQFVQALPLSDPAGAQVMGARVRLPAIALRDGSNELRLEASLHGRETPGECIPRFTEHLRLTLFEDSHIDLPPLRGRIRFPDLAVLARTALPHADPQTGLDLYLTDAQPHTLSAALTLVAKLRQVARSPLPRIHVSKVSPETRTAPGGVWIGPLTALPAAVREAVPHFMPSGRWQRLTLAERESYDVQKGLMAWLRQPFTGLLQQARSRQPVQADVTLAAGSVRGGALVQYLDADGRPITVLTADDPQTLERGVSRLTQHDVWGSLRGGAVAWNGAGEPYAWSPPHETVVLGEMPWRLRLGYYLSDRPWLLLLLILSLIGLLVATGGWLLRRRARQRLG